MSLSGLAEEAIDEFLSLENEGLGVDSATSLRSARNDCVLLPSERNDRDSVSRMLEWIPCLQGVNGCCPAKHAFGSIGLPHSDGGSETGGSETAGSPGNGNAPNENCQPDQGSGEVPPRCRNSIKSLNSSGEI
jgi:hypothetical protein